MFLQFDANSKSTKSNDKKKKTTNQNPIQPSQSGRLKISRSKELVPGTVDDDDIIELPETPSPVKKPATFSIFARKPKENANTSNIQTRSSPLKSQQQNHMLEATIESPPTKKPSPKKVGTSKRAIASDSDDDFSFIDLKRTKKVKEQPQPVRGAGSRLTKNPTAKTPSTSKTLDSDLFEFNSNSQKKSEPMLTRRNQKVSQTSSVDDEFSFVAPKRSRQTDDVNASISSQVSQLGKSLNNSTISSKTSGLKRVNIEPHDDLFDFDSKRSKKEEPKLTRRKQKVSETVTSKPSASTSVSARSVAAIASTSSDIPIDLAPGRECASTQWISNESLSSFKKEESESEEGQLASPAVLDTPTKKTFCHIVPTSSNVSAIEVRGKTFKKKINYRPQTTVIPTRDLSLQDVNLLYPKPF